MLYNSTSALVEAEYRSIFQVNINSLSMRNTEANPARNLHIKFVELGKSRNRLTRELLLLLPEIYKSGIYRKYCATIVEYAGRFGGLSKGVVLKRLRLEKRLEDRPMLKEAILSEGIHKVALLAGVVTKENEKFLVKKLKGMSKPAVAQMAKEIREKREDDVDNEDDGGAQQLKLGDVDGGNAEALHCKAVPAKIKIELDEDMTGKFLQLKKKFGGNLQNKEVLEKILEIAMKSILPEFADGEKSKSVPGDNFLSEESQQKAKPASRTIFPYLQRKLLSETAGKCAYPNCNHPAEIFHHPDRFAISRSHESLKPLCKIHHEFMHNGLVKNEQAPPANWQFDLAAKTSGPIAKIDELYRKHRNMRR